MAKISITSLTQTQSMEHAKNGKSLSELACAKIAGFHLLKRDTCSTWRLRYRNFNNQQKLIKLGKFVFILSSADVIAMCDSSKNCMFAVGC